MFLWSAQNIKNPLRYTTELHTELEPSKGISRRVRFPSNLALNHHWHSPKYVKLLIIWPVLSVYV